MEAPAPQKACPQHGGQFGWPSATIALQRYYVGSKCENKLTIVADFTSTKFPTFIEENLRAVPELTTMGQQLPHARAHNGIATRDRSGGNRECYTRAVREK